MSFIFGAVPYFRVLVRREYTRNLADGVGEYYAGLVHAVRCLRGHSLWFQTMLTDGPGAGAAFLLPIEALCTKPCEKPADLAYVQPWDVFSQEFGVCEIPLVARSHVFVLPDRRPAQYRFTIDFAGTDLAEDPEQHKHLHVVTLDCGYVGAFPNNRLLWSDPAFWKVTEEKPDFLALAPEFRAEGRMPSGKESTSV